MSLLPISYYPMPSDDGAQLQVLQEQKGELRDQLQTMQSSGDGQQTRRQEEAVENRISEVDRDSKSLQNKQAVKKADSTKQVQKQQLQQTDEKRVQERKQRLDTTA